MTNKHTKKQAKGLKYQTNRNKLTCSVMGVENSGAGSVAVPEKHRLRKVTRIDDKAFADSPFREITLPDSVTEIGNRAFHGCKNLLEIRLGNSVRSIGIGAFQGCENLYSVTLPSTVTVIGTDAFADCANLRSIVIPDSVEGMENSVFSGCEKLSRILFTGTKRQWEKVYPYSTKKLFRSACTVECTDGSVEF